MNGNGTNGGVVRYVTTLLVPLLALAVAWGSLHTRLDHLHDSILKIETDIKEIEVVLLHLQLEQREFQTFKTQWLQQWGQYLGSDSND